jgi:hypothetical protein
MYLFYIKGFDEIETSIVGVFLKNELSVEIYAKTESEALNKVQSITKRNTYYIEKIKEVN